MTDVTTTTRWAANAPTPGNKLWTVERELPDGRREADPYAYLTGAEAEARAYVLNAEAGQ